jgi:hypothetical protein
LTKRHASDEHHDHPDIARVPSVIRADVGIGQQGQYDERYDRETSAGVDFGLIHASQEGMHRLAGTQDGERRRARRQANLDGDGDCRKPGGESHDRGDCTRSREVTLIGLPSIADSDHSAGGDRHPSAHHSGKQARQPSAKAKKPEGPETRDAQPGTAAAQCPSSLHADQQTRGKRRRQSDQQIRFIHFAST